MCPCSALEGWPGRQLDWWWMAERRCGKAPSRPWQRPCSMWWTSDGRWVEPAVLELREQVVSGAGKVAALVPLGTTAGGRVVSWSRGRRRDGLSIIILRLSFVDLEKWKKSGIWLLANPSLYYYNQSRRLRTHSKIKAMDNLTRALVTYTRKAAHCAWPDFELFFIIWNFVYYFVDGFFAVKEGVR